VGLESVLATQTSVTSVDRVAKSIITSYHGRAKDTKKLVFYEVGWSHCWWILQAFQGSRDGQSPKTVFSTPSS